MEQRVGQMAVVIKPKVLSVRQPWAWAIINAGKDVENRDWATRYRGDVLIHASKILEKGNIPLFEPGEPEIYETGGIVGIVRIVDCVTRSKSRWFCGNHGFVLDNPRALPFTPMRGRLKFFAPPDDFWETEAGKLVMAGL